MKILETVKKHPYIIGGSVAGIILLYFVFRGSGGSASATAGVDPSLVAANAALQQQQDQEQFQLAAINAQAGAQQALTSLQGQIQTQQQVNAISGQLNLAQLQVSAQENQTAAQLADQQLADATQITTANINAVTQQTIAKLQTNQNIQYANLIAGVQKAQINAVSNQGLLQTAGGILSNVFGGGGGGGPSFFSQLGGFLFG